MLEICTGRETQTGLDEPSLGSYRYIPVVLDLVVPVGSYRYMPVVVVSEHLRGRLLKRDVFRFSTGRLVPVQALNPK